MFCAFNRPRYQVSVYRTIGPLVSSYVLSIFLIQIQYAMYRSSSVAVQPGLIKTCPRNPNTSFVVAQLISSSRIYIETGFCLFLFWLRLYVPVNNFSVMSGRNRDKVGN